MRCKGESGCRGKGLQRLFGIKVLQLPGPSLHTGDNVIYLVRPHPSQYANAMQTGL